MPELFIISKEWKEQFWFSTGGTRAKKYIQAPDGKFYYFKRSQHKPAIDTKPGKDFTFEFWNEIIAFELGQMLGFEMLRYDIAIEGEIMGCISESMINSEKEELVEGVKYLQAFSPNYDPEKKEHQNSYSFHLIKNSLESANLLNYIDDIIKLILFDAIIGNGDRHQENWAIITEQELKTEAIKAFEKKEAFQKLSSIMKTILRLNKRLYVAAQNRYKKRKHALPKSFYIINYRFSPIYDSGSSLGRELLDDKVRFYLTSERDLNSYIEKGLSEIHWQGKKLPHFQLIGKINETTHSEMLQSYISQIIRRFNPEKLAMIIYDIDRKVPETHNHYKIPLIRKELIIKIITLRFQKLRQLSNEGI